MNFSAPVLSGMIGLGVYADLLGVGGYIGYKKAGSRPSLVAGSISSALAALSLILTFFGGFGFWLGLVLSNAMLVVFAIRFTKTRKFMPSGLLAGCSLVMIGLMIWALRNLG